MRFYEYSDLKFNDKKEYDGNTYFVQDGNTARRDYVIRTERCMMFVTIYRKFFDDIPQISVEENDEYFESIITSLIDGFYTVSE